MHRVYNVVYYVCARVCIQAHLCVCFCRYVLHFYASVHCKHFHYSQTWLFVCRNFSFYERQSFSDALLLVHSNLTGTSSCTLPCWKDKKFMEKTLSVLQSWAGNIVSNLKKMSMCVFVCVWIHVFICLWLRARRHILLLVNYPKQCGVGRNQRVGAEEVK